MAIELVSSEPSATKSSIHRLEDASTDLNVADCLILAADHFVYEIATSRGPTGYRPDQFVFGWASTALTLLGELRDKIQEAKAAIDHAVTAETSGALPSSKSEIE